jgi:uncharacterized protein (DUF2126 family)
MHAKAKIETYTLKIDQPCSVRWQQDAGGNHLARVTFGAGSRIDAFDVLVEMAVDIRPVNPFDFFIDPRCKELPFAYEETITRDLAPFLDRDDPAYATGPRFEELLAEVPREGTTIDVIVAINSAINAKLKYVIREEAGVWTPEKTLEEGRGSCRDSAVLLVAALRSFGLAARFVSGYLVQLTDEGMIPDEPRGVSRDVVDLHAWAEVYLPGGGWIGLDATSGLLAGEGHIPLACTARPASAAAIDGTSDVVSEDVTFEMKIGRLGHEPRPTAPFPDATWDELLEAGDIVDATLRDLGVELTIGGEPTYTSRLYPAAPEWNTDALGSTKWTQGLLLAEALKKRFAPGGILMHRFGKQYPGESLPRWALDVIARRDGTPLISDSSDHRIPADVSSANRFIDAVAARLGQPSELAIAAYEDPWHYLREEARLPVGVDPLRADLEDADERRSLARVLDRGLRTVVGYVLPLAPATDGGWLSDRWIFRREQLFLVPGDSPIGLRLPLDSINGAPPLPIFEERYEPIDPRRTELVDAQKQAAAEAKASARGKVHVREAPLTARGIRTALCVEPRDGRLFIFLPPLPTFALFVDLIAILSDCARALGVPIAFEGYPPPKSPDLWHLLVTPDPGVLEVNIPPTRSSREHVEMLEAIADAALACGLHTERYQLDGRQAGSGGGNHITLGGATPLASPFIKRPDLLASLLTFVQHHPSISYLFTGLFVGPTSQAPRVDEARHDALDELEIALEHAFDVRQPAPWLSDALFRNLLVDVSGNTHRTEICIDKLFDPNSPHGRQGLVELRAFEMPPHVRMAVAEVALVRALIAAFAKEPYRAPLVRWGRTLHDKMLLPTWLWADFEDVLAFLDARGLPLPREAYRAFLEQRMPIVGHVQLGELRLELRNAIEPWNVLGEEMSSTGTARYVDSSMERIEVRAEGLIADRHVVLVNGLALPMRPTGVASERVGGVRFRAWAPPHSLHPHIGIHHPLRFEVLDTWAKRSLGGCGYHVWHPGGRSFDAPPLTRFEAAARRAQRFTLEGPSPWPVIARIAKPHPRAPYTLDLRRFSGDHPMPEIPEEDA